MEEMRLIQLLDWEGVPECLYLSLRQDEISVLEGEIKDAYLYCNSILDPSEHHIQDYAEELLSKKGIHRMLVEHEVYLDKGIVI